MGGQTSKLQQPLRALPTSTLGVAAGTGNSLSAAEASEAETANADGAGMGAAKDSNSCSVCTTKTNYLEPTTTTSPTTTTNPSTATATTIRPNPPLTEPAIGPSESSSSFYSSSMPSPSSPKCLAYMHSGCPANRKEVGRATWAFLHTMAAYYPENPTDAQQKEMHDFMLALGRVYPCGYCADRTSEEMVVNPPRTQNQTVFAQWMCEIHNEVNERLGKPVFDCSKVGERWKYGPPDGSCNASH